jgi:hypothetical protein
MSISFEQFVTLCPGSDVVGGKVILRIDGKHTVMGELLGHTFNLTFDGESYLDALKAQPVAEAEAEAEKPRRGRPPKAEE